MKRLLFFFGVVALAATAPQKPGPGGDQAVAILKQDFDQQPDGSYRYSYEAENGIKAEETGTLKKASGPDATDVIIAQGGFSYTAPDGTQINLNYIADDENGFRPEGDFSYTAPYGTQINLNYITDVENGFRPEGAHLPTPPPIPPAIQKALDYLATLPPPRN
ncbi:insect cuticle protein domain-containing protein [Phthorimaea operculella]|nr:insect cuticle protein domain-containing protein [Phthorimaea operculella]